AILFGRDVPRGPYRPMCRSVAAHADPTRFTTMGVVEDLEELRNRLGYDAVDLYGTSYGTRVALAYLERHPQRVRDDSQRCGRAAIRGTELICRRHRARIASYDRGLRRRSAM